MLHVNCKVIILKHCAFFVSSSFEGPKPNYDEPDFSSDQVTSAQQHPQSSQHQQTSNLRRELPKDLSDEALKREAGFWKKKLKLKKKTLSSKTYRGVAKTKMTE